MNKTYLRFNKEKDLLKYAKYFFSKGLAAFISISEAEFLFKKKLDLETLISALTVSLLNRRDVIHYSLYSRYVKSWMA